MSSYRSRSRETGAKVTTTIKGVNEATLLVTSVKPSSVQTETMIDFVTKDWAKLKRNGFYPPPPDFAKATRLSDASRRGVRDRQNSSLRSFIPPVNTLTYTSVRDEEPVDRIRFTVDPTSSWLTVAGCCTQGLNGQWSALFPTHPLPVPVSHTVLTAVLKSAVLQRCADTDFAFGEDMLEVRQTLNFIRKPFGSLYRLLKSMRKTIDRKKALSGKRYAQETAAAWAEYRFAASPLVRSADDAIHASADYFHKKYAPGFVRVAESRESSARSTIDSTTTGKFPYSGYTGVTWTVDRQSLRTVTNHVTVGLKAFHTDSGSLQSLIGLRGRDIPLTLWQVFPLSFMIDRIYDVSGWLQAASSFFSSNVSFSGGWVSVRSTSAYTRRYSGIRSAFPTFNYARPACSKPWLHEEFSYSRDIWVPTVSEARPPAMAGRLVNSLTHTADLSAILISQASSLTRRR
jgi:hypothetical protein